MKKISVLILTLFFIGISILFGNDKIFDWPLDINNGYSSSFQEYRTGHFHGGIDIRTFQKSGYPVYSVMDGYIYKIRYVRRGCGKGVFIRHNNGMKSLYFHLEKFTENIENTVLNIQKIKRKKYIGNYFPKKPIYIKKGQLIGYSGETGSGFPHLHLEIRDKDEARINPFKLIKFPEKDKNFPVLKRIMLRSVNNTLINGKVGEFTFNFKKTKKGEFSIQKEIFINGEVEILLNSFDITDTGRHAAPSKVEMFLNGRKIYFLEFTKFEYNDNNQLGFVYDMLFSSSSSYFFNLFNQKGFLLSGDSKNTKSIHELLKSDKNELIINVYDNFNNKSSGKFIINNYSLPQIGIDSEFKVTKFFSGSATKILLKIFGGKKRMLYGKEYSIQSIKKDDFIMFPDYLKRKFTYVEFIFLKNNVVIGKNSFSFNNNSFDLMKDIKIDKFINREYIVIKVINDFIGTNNITLEVKQGKQKIIIPPLISSEGVYFGFKPLGYNNEVKLNFSLFNNKKLSSIIQRRINLIKVSDGYSQKFKFDEFSIYFGERAVREDKTLIVEKVSFPSSFPVSSSQFRVYPHTFPFLDSVYFKFKKKLDNPRQVGIFKYSLKRKNWKYVSTSFNGENNTYKTRSITTGIFSLMRDIFPPVIRIVKPKKLSRNNLFKFKIFITDKGKGVNYLSIVCKLNGEKISSEYDPDRKTLDIENLSIKIKTGWNSIFVALKDKAGNFESKSFRFKLEKSY